MTLMDLTYQLFGVTLDLEMTIQARHIPGCLNRTADLLSRRHQVMNTVDTEPTGGVSALVCVGSADDRLDGDRADDSAADVHQPVSRPMGTCSRCHVLRLERDGHVSLSTVGDAGRGPSEAGARGVCGNIDRPTQAKQSVVPTPPGAPD